MVSLLCFKNKKKKRPRRNNNNNSSNKKKSSTTDDDDRGLLSPNSSAASSPDTRGALSSTASTKETGLSGRISRSTNNNYNHDDSSIPTIDSDYNQQRNSNFSVSDAGGTIGSRSLANFSHATSAFGGDYTRNNSLGGGEGGGGDSVERRLYNDVYMSDVNQHQLSHLIQPPTTRGSSNHNNNDRNNNSNGNYYGNGSGYGAQETTLSINAPKGKLGVVIDTPPTTGGSTTAKKTMPIVHAVKDSSPIAHQIQVGDKLIAVDDEDVTSMTAIQVSKLLARKGGDVRKLTIVRTMRGRGGIY